MARYGKDGQVVTRGRATQSELLIFKGGGEGVLGVIQEGRKEGIGGGQLGKGWGRCNEDFLKVEREGGLVVPLVPVQNSHELYNRWRADGGFSGGGGLSGRAEEEEGLRAEESKKISLFFLLMEKTKFSFIYWRWRRRTTLLSSAALRSSVMKNASLD